MTGKWPWFERHFTFDYPPAKFPDIVERLRGTPARAEELTRGLAAGILTRPEGDSWSIQKNVGHLADVEPLWMGRINDILKGDEVMREADLTNGKTAAAPHDSRPLQEVLSEVRQVRAGFIRRLEALSDADVARASIHPRTKLRMRIVDLCYFAAEHDDYHLSRISEMKRLFLIA